MYETPVIDRHPDSSITRRAAADLSTPAAQFPKAMALCTSLSLAEIQGAEAGVAFLASDWMPENARHVRDRLDRGSNYSWDAASFVRLETALVSLFHTPPLLFSTSRHNVLLALDLCPGRVARAMYEPIVQRKA